MAATHERARLVLDLFDQYYERVYAFLRKSTTPDVAEDLSQEVFVRLLKHPELERLTISISYLLKIAHNLLRRRYARASRLHELLEERFAMDGGDEVARSRSRTRDANGGADVGTDVLETALGLLAKDEQDAIRLIVCEGKSYQHAAEALGVSVTTINNWKHRGIVKLRALVQDDRERETAPTPVRTRAAEVEITTQPVRLSTRRHGRVDTDAGPSPVMQDRTSNSMPRSMLAWRAQQDEVA
jgi:RNA polymerase sigma factor (sigma-70 family)